MHSTDSCVFRMSYVSRPRTTLDIDQHAGRWIGKSYEDERRPISVRILEREIVRSDSLFGDVLDSTDTLDVGRRLSFTREINQRFRSRRGTAAGLHVRRQIHSQCFRKFVQFEVRLGDPIEKIVQFQQNARFPVGISKFATGIEAGGRLLDFGVDVERTVLPFRCFQTTDAAVQSCSDEKEFD